MRRVKLKCRCGLHARPLFIRTAFPFRHNVVVTTVPYLIGRAVRLRDLVAHDELLDETVE